MIALLKPGGHLVLTMPYNETKYVEDVYKLPGGDLGEPQDYRCASYNRAVLDQWLAEALLRGKSRFGRTRRGVPNNREKTRADDHSQKTEFALIPTYG